MADHAADVAEDYQQALEDLTMNSRYEIAALTNIARENAAHGFAIAEVLANHIKKVPPARTLPALYVLDSVVKNVPTPYTLYLGPKLYSIFMGAYTKVDNNTRKKMDEMLRTWKEPVPGSISTKPVFPHEYVKPIELALMGAKEKALAAQQSSLQGQQQLMRGRQAVGPIRSTPTPPTGRAYQPPPSSLGQQPYAMRPNNGPNGAPPHASQQQQPPSGGSYSHYQQQQQPPPPGRDVYGTPQPGISIDKLKDDLQQLIVAEKAEFAQDPLDTSKQTKLKALLDLQSVIENQNVSQDQLMVIRDRVAELAVKLHPQSQQHRPQVTAAPPAPATTIPPYNTHFTHTPTPPVAVSQQPQPPPAVPQLPAVLAAMLGRPQQTPPVVAPTPPPPRPAAAPVPGGGGLSLDAILGQGAQGALASLLANRPSATPPQASTPQPPVLDQILGQQQQRPQQPPPAAAPPPAPAAGPASASSLLAMLRQSGLLNAAGTATGATPTPTPPPPHPGAVPGMFPPRGFPMLPIDPNIIQLTPSSLKFYRPHLAPLILDALGPPCTQCGRRFRTDEQGRRKKTAHMDWHFRVHQRVAEAERRGQHRSWFVDEMDWIRSHEEPDIDYVAPAQGYSSPSSSSANHASSGGGNATRQQKKNYIPVPDDSSKINSSCPICQEKFEMKWLDEAQEWVWMDTVLVGGRAFHGSCHAEVQAASRGNGGYRQTPDRVLGKRKAEDDGGYNGFQRTKVKMEGY
ncbi:protein PCF11 [Podospora australis]|uniref:Protein PCF11 n=1 Tax=Podospora australis TaxID=1536484 RepID=A0AAN6WQY8_9PEZI|nr:protein PCF11 [Podospora australis]